MLFTIVSLVTTSATSSAAQSGNAATGAGGGTGFEYTNTQHDDCPVPPFRKVASSRFILHHTGSYSAVDVDEQPIATYVGPTVVHIEVGPHVISPEGTYLCVRQNGVEVPVPSPVPILAATVTGQAKDPVAGQVTGAVSCSSLNPAATNVYTRRAGEAVTFTFTNSNCQINGNIPNPPGTTTVADVRHVIEGTLTPCAPLLPVCATAQQGNPSGYVVTSYQAAGPSPA